MNGAAVLAMADVLRHRLAGQLQLDDTAITLNNRDAHLMPAVRTRWMLVVAVKRPDPAVAFAVRSSHGIDLALGPAAEAFTWPTTELPSFDCHVGPA